jgi:hypothetical protein
MYTVSCAPDTCIGVEEAMNPVILAESVTAGVNVVGMALAGLENVVMGPAEEMQEYMATPTCITTPPAPPYHGENIMPVDPFNPQFCPLDLFLAKVEHVTSVCCGNADDRHCGDEGVPATCSFDCGRAFTVYMTDCKNAITAFMGDTMPMYDDFNTLCAAQDARSLVHAIVAARCWRGPRSSSTTIGLDHWAYNEMGRRTTQPGGGDEGPGRSGKFFTLYKLPTQLGQTTPSGRQLSNWPDNEEGDFMYKSACNAYDLQPVGCESQNYNKFGVISMPHEWGCDMGNNGQLNRDTC